MTIQPSRDVYRGDTTLSASEVTALGALTTSNDVSDVLAVLNTAVARGRAVTGNSIGKASSTLY